MLPAAASFLEVVGLEGAGIALMSCMDLMLDARARMDPALTSRLDEPKTSRRYQMPGLGVERSCLCLVVSLFTHSVTQAGMKRCWRLKNEGDDPGNQLKKRVTHIVLSRP